MSPTPTEIDEYIQQLHSGQTISWGDGDPDPYGGGAHWLTEFFYYTQQRRIFSADSYWPSQYHPEPETQKWSSFSEQEFKKIVAKQPKSKIYVSYSPCVFKEAFDKYEQSVANFDYTLAISGLDIAKKLHPILPKPKGYDEYKSLFAKAKSD